MISEWSANDKETYISTSAKELKKTNIPGEDEDKQTVACPLTGTMKSSAYKNKKVFWPALKEINAIYYTQAVTIHKAKWINQDILFFFRKKQTNKKKL